MTTAHSMKTAKTHLATYGTLAPGRPNHHQLVGLTGHWQQGTVKGRLVDAGWGAGLGYPGLILDPAGDIIEVHIFQSTDLPAHWQRLDEFEGAGYQRVTTQVTLSGGNEQSAFIYVVRADNPP